MIDYRNLVGAEISSECSEIAGNLSTISQEIDTVKNSLNQNNWDAGTRKTVEAALEKFKGKIDYATKGFKNLNEIGSLISDCNELANKISTEEAEFKRLKIYNWPQKTDKMIQLENDINSLKSTLSSKETKLSELQNNY